MNVPILSGNSKVIDCFPNVAKDFNKYSLNSVVKNASYRYVNYLF